MGTALAEAGVTINGQSGGILPVLVFGAGTDYALLLIARYREELRKHEDKHEAMQIALRRAGPAIFASGMTVIAGLLCLALAEVNGTAGLGPIGAMGIALAMLTSLTLLPAIVVACGRRSFWPFIPHVGDQSSDETHGFWRGVGERVARSPMRVTAGAAAVLAICMVGLVSFNTDLTSGDFFRNDVESVKGQELVSSAFPAGSNAPTDVIVPDPARAEAVRSALGRDAEVAAVREAERGEPGVRLEAVLRDEPYSTAAYDQIPRLRDVAKAAGGDDVLVGGPTASEADLRKSAARDNRLIIPIVLVVIFVILAILLRAVIAPLILIGTVIASFAASLGATAFVSAEIFGFPGLEPSLPLLAFVFLVALGVDYNIFLMARVREEALVHGTRDGMLRGLAVTGAVITSAGIVLAGTFSVLGVLPLVFLTQLGFAIAFGVLLDTFLVRSVLVPALTFLIGPRIWWPSSLANEDHGDRPAQRERPEATIA
jgi:RND superfamily putative drug exporter